MSDASSGSSSSNVRPNYSIETVTSKEGLSKLRNDWNRLSEIAAEPNVFMTFDWFEAWNRYFSHADPGARRELNVLVLKKGGRVTGISPLIRRAVTRFGMTVRRLEFVSLESDYNEMVVGEDPLAQSQTIIEFLARTQNQWDVSDLRGLRNTAPAAAVIKKALSQTGLNYRILPEEERCPYLRIKGPWAERPSGNGQHVAMGLRTLRKKQRRLERLGTEGLRIRIIENPQDEPQLLEKLVALETRKKVHGEPAGHLIADCPEVFQSLFDTLGPRGWIYIAMMELGDRPIAWRLGFRCGQKLWDYLTAYDANFSRLSPGTMLIPAVLDYGLSHHYLEHDFLRGEEVYKMDWSTGCHERFRVAIWNRNGASMVHAFVFPLKQALAKLRGKSE